MPPYLSNRRYSLIMRSASLLLRWRGSLTGCCSSGAGTFRRVASVEDVPARLPRHTSPGCYTAGSGCASFSPRLNLFARCFIGFGFSWVDNKLPCVSSSAFGLVCSSQYVFGWWHLQTSQRRYTAAALITGIVTMARDASARRLCSADDSLMLRPHGEEASEPLVSLCSCCSLELRERPCQQMTPFLCYPPSPALIHMGGR
jgi:hypothetical protein